MKRLTFALVCLGTFALSAFGQSGRPRVVATPTPQAPRIQNDDPQTADQRGAPLLRGGNQPRVQQPIASPTPPVNVEDEVIKIDTNLVTMPVSVLDRDGRFISGLTQKDFQIFENGVQQKVEYFQSVEQPFTVVLLIDVSPSTRFRIDEIQNAAISFVNQLRPSDRVMVISFDDNIHVLTDPTSDRYRLRSAIRMTQFGDGTSLYEAVDHALNREMKRIEGRKAIVLFTDGVDTTSRRADFESTLADAEESEALIYPVRYNTQQSGNAGWGGRNQRRRGGIFDDLLGQILLGGGNIRVMGGGSGQSPAEYARGQQYLELLAQNSGGRKFEAESLHNVEAAFAGIAEELRQQYSLGYSPDNPGQPGERKQIKIRVMRPDVVVRAKNSYIVGQTTGR